MLPIPFQDYQNHILLASRILLSNFCDFCAFLWLLYPIQKGRHMNVIFLLTLVAILSVNSIQAQEKPVDKSIVDTKIASAIMGEERRASLFISPDSSGQRADFYVEGTCRMGEVFERE
jgi:hypothetical protein